jgi:hypothetical protein
VTNRSIRGARPDHEDPGPACPHRVGKFKEQVWGESGERRQARTARSLRAASALSSPCLAL